EAPQQLGDIMVAARRLAGSLGPVLENLASDRSANHQEHHAIYRAICELQSRLIPPRPTSEDCRQALRNYCDRLINRHCRLNTGHILVDAAINEDEIREPPLADTFVEPFLTRAGHLREARDEVDRLLDLSQDSEAPPHARAEASRTLLVLQTQTW